ncbi:MAG: hypothetical protein ACLFSI_05015 [Halorhodospira sp.]
MTDFTLTDVVTAAATGVIAVSAVVSACLTYGLVQENRRLRKAGTDPYVIAYPLQDRNRPEILNLNIKNVGAGPAYDVAIELQGDKENLRKYIDSSLGAWEGHPIPVLPQGEKIETILNIGHMLFDKYGDCLLMPFTAAITYETSEGKPEKHSYSIDVKPFEGCRFTRTPEVEVASSLEDLSKTFKKIVSPRGRLKVDTMNQSQPNVKK